MRKFMFQKFLHYLILISKKIFNLIKINFLDYNVNAVRRNLKEKTRQIMQNVL